MGCTQDTARNLGDNPDDVFGQISGLMPVACRVAIAPELECIAIDMKLRARADRRGPLYGFAQLLLGPNEAMDLALRLCGSVERLSRMQPYDPERLRDDD